MRYMGACLRVGVALRIQHMQKALTQMNMKLQHIIIDITGKTGTDIIKAIVSGERYPWKLAQFRRPGMKADEATIAKSLQGHWREEHIFELTQALELYRLLPGRPRSHRARLSAPARRRRILAEELLLAPMRLERIEGDIGSQGRRRHPQRGLEVWPETVYFEARGYTPG